MKQLALYSLLLFSFSGCMDEEKPVCPLEDSPPDTSSVSKQDTSQKSELVKAYTIAISDYIKAANKHNKLTFDTLFFLLHSQSPDFQLPAIIEHTGICYTTQEEIDKKRMYRKTLYTLNFLGWLNNTNAEFSFVTFSPGYAHDFDYFIYYDRDTVQKELRIRELRCEDYIFSKQGNLEQIKVYVDGKYVKDKPIPHRK